MAGRSSQFKRPSGPTSARRAAVQWTALAPSTLKRMALAPAAPAMGTGAGACVVSAMTTTAAPRESSADTAAGATGNRVTGIVLTEVVMLLSGAGPESQARRRRTFAL